MSRSSTESTALDISMFSNIDDQISEPILELCQRTYGYFDAIASCKLV